MSSFSRKLDKWETLEHKGPLFSLPYRRLPEECKLLYNGNPVELSEEAEEMAMFHAEILMADPRLASKETYKENFFHDWKEHLKQTEDGKRIRQLDSCDFSQILKYLETTQEERLWAKKQHCLTKQKEHNCCRVDGKDVVLFDFVVDSPGLHTPKNKNDRRLGRLRRRIKPENVEINASNVEYFDGKGFASVETNKKVRWLARWKHPVVGKYQYLNLPSDDKERFDRARRMPAKDKDILQRFLDTDEVQLGLMLYFIQKQAFGPGKREGTALHDVNIGTLKIKMVKLRERNHRYYVCVDPGGRDQQPNCREIQVEEDVYRALQKVIQEKIRNTELFDQTEEGSWFAAKITKQITFLNDKLSVSKFKRIEFDAPREELSVELIRGDGGSYTIVVSMEQAKYEQLKSERGKVHAAKQLLLEEINCLRKYISTFKMKNAQVKDSNGSYSLKLTFRDQDCHSHCIGLSISSDTYTKFERWIEEKAGDNHVFESLKYCTLYNRIRNFRWTARDFRIRAASLLFEKIVDDLSKRLSKGQADTVSAKEILREAESKVCCLLHQDSKATEVDNLADELDQMGYTSESDTSEIIDMKDCDDTLYNSKILNYIDPRITIAWCNKFQIEFPPHLRNAGWALKEVGSSTEFRFGTKRS